MQEYSTKSCVVCETDFLCSTKYPERNRKYCSRKCANAACNKGHYAKPAENAVTVTEKWCTRCDQMKSPSDFYRDGRRADGLRPWCKSCHTSYNRETYDPVYNLERWQRYYADPEIQRKYAERKKAWASSHPEEYREQLKRGRERERTNSKIKAKATYDYTLDWIQQIKTSSGCSVCGERHPACLEFHHLNPSEKSFNIGSALMLRLPKHIIEEEMGRCELLCSNCHKRRHWEERRVGCITQDTLPL